MMLNSPKICILVGEPSGDMLGAHLVESLRKQNPIVHFMGTAGDRMTKLGLKSIMPLGTMSVMGWLVSPLQIWHIWKAYRLILKIIQIEKPDIIVTIDFPGINFKIAKELKKSGSTIPLIHYVAPTVWAWRPKRAAKIAKIFDHLLTLFPFEPPYFTVENLPTTFVGHPLVQENLDQGDGIAFRQKFHIDPDAPLISILPGSRQQEIKSHLPIFKEAIALLQQQYPTLEVIVPTLPSIQHLINLVNWPCKIHVISDLQDKKNAYKASMMAIVASGTATLELALAKLPLVVSYKTAWLNGWIAKRLLKTPYVCMINILKGREVVPELLQNKCTPADIYQSCLKILQNPKLQQEQFETIKEMLKAPAPFDSPGEAAANKILEHLK